jgi:hypothetical protein
MEDRLPLRWCAVVLMVGSLGCWLVLFAVSFLLTLFGVWLGVL